MLLGGVARGVLDLGERWSAVLTVAASVSYNLSVAFAGTVPFPRACVARGGSVNVLEHALVTRLGIPLVKPDLVLVRLLIVLALSWPVQSRSFLLVRVLQILLAL